MPAAKPTTADEYVASLPPDRREAITAVRRAINENLPKGYREGIQYGMIGWCVPHALFPAGYHCDPKQPLPFAALASNKSGLSLHLMFIYLDGKQREWFQSAWRKTGKRLDMGKACIRVKRLEDVALDVVGEAVARVPVDTYVKTYQSLLGTKGGGGAKGSAKATKKKPKK
jgi:hypothetical protein